MKKKITGTCSTYNYRIYETTLFLSWRRLANDNFLWAYYNERETNSLFFLAKSRYFSDLSVDGGVQW